MVNEANSLRTLDGTVVLLKTDPVAKWLVLTFAILSTILALSATILRLHFWKVRNVGIVSHSSDESLPIFHNSIYYLGNKYISKLQLLNKLIYERHHMYGG